MIFLELIVKLKQHTPIIHFQWDQTGATLRASELKPKLDDFLYSKNLPELRGYFKSNPNCEAGKRNNLPYKVQVESVAEKKGIVFEIERDGRFFPQFFGNLEKKEGGKNSEENESQKSVKKKRFVFCNEPIEIKFVSFDENILTVVEENLAEFFFVTNFGTRQSKGFGSFYIDPLDSLYKNPEEFTKGPEKITNYYFILDAVEDDLYKKYKNLFTSIDLFYRTLRSGINIKRGNGTEFYFKSIMFLYAKSKGWIWDKNALKEKFVSKKELDDQSEKYPSSDILNLKSGREYLVRDLLGVAPLQHYDYYSFVLQYDEENEIERFKSPITFKPLLLNRSNEAKFTVYIILNPIPDGFFGKNFVINKVVKKGKNEKEVSDSITLETPPLTDRFNIEEFLEFALKVDIDKHVDEESRKDSLFRVIKNIYSQLNLQVGGKNG